MSTLKTDTITNVAGSGGPTLTNGATFGSATFAAPSGSAPMYACRAWVNFDGTGSVAIRASGNVTDITDHGTGNYTVNITTAMPDTDYLVVPLQGPWQGGSRQIVSPFSSSSSGTLSEPTTNSVRMTAASPGSTTLVDYGYMGIAIFR